MKLYRNIQPGETLQAGDQILADPPQWVPVNSSLFGLSPALRGLPEYRRPVDAVPREEHERLRQRLAEAESLLGEAMRGGQQLYAEVAELQSQPRLQRVTPEAMVELESREAWVILFRHKESIHCRYCVVRWDAVAGRWWGTPAGEENPLDWHWFIEPSTIPEVQG